jgi:hypothetical protein
MSHLSDAQHLIGCTDIQSIKKMNNHINFAKLVMSGNHDTRTDIDADEWWEQFTKTQYYRK